MTKNYDDMKKAYQSMLEPLKDDFTPKESTLTCMPITIGDNYEDAPIRLMYVGRAVNGWQNEWEYDSTQKLVEQVFDHFQDMSEIKKGVVHYTKDDKDCQYNYNRSPFWQLCHALLNQYGIEENWSDHVAWTNLYKVSGAEKGNPKNDIISQTINGCADILFYEILCAKPTHIVFVTDTWWIKPTMKDVNEMAFIDKLGSDSFKEISNGIIVGSGVVSNSAFGFSASERPKYVVTKRPEGSSYSRVEHAKAIIEAFDKIK